MTHYELCGEVLAADLRFPELTRARGAGRAPAWTLECRRASGASRADAHPWYHEWRSGDGTPWLQLARLDGAHLLRFPSLADFTLAGDGVIGCRMAPSASLVTIRHLFLDQVLPLALDRTGQVVLHASAVEIAHGAVVFVGESGAGKSTLAASLACAGAPLVTDDFLVLVSDGPRVLATPSYAAVRLWADMLTALGGTRRARVSPDGSKHRARAGAQGWAFARGRLPVRAVYVLRPDDGPGGRIHVAPLTGSAAFMALFEHAFHLDLGARARVEHTISALAGLARQLPLFVLSYPRRLECLPEVHETVRGLPLATRAAS